MDSTITTHTDEGVEREEIFVMTQTEVTNITEENTTVEQPVAVATEPPVAMEQFLEGHYDDERLPSSADKVDELPTAEDETAGVNELDDTSKVTSVEEDNDDANFTSVKIYRFLFGGSMKDKETISADEYDDEVQDGEEKISSVDPDPPRDISEPTESEKTEEVFEKIPAAENENIESANDASPSLTGRFLNIFKRGTTEGDQERKLDDEAVEDTPTDRRESLESRESEILVEHETAQDENDEKESAENLPILLAGKFRNIFQTRQDDERDDHSLSQATQDPEVEIASASRQQELDDGLHETGDEDEVELLGAAKTFPADISNGRYEGNESESEVIDEISETIVVGVESNPQLEEDRTDKDTQISSPEEYSVAEKIMIFETPRNEEDTDRASVTEETDNEIAAASSQTEKDKDYKNTNETEDPQTAGAIEYLPMLIASKLRNAFTRNADNEVPQAETTTAEEIVTDPDRDLNTASPQGLDDYKHSAESGSPESNHDAKETTGVISPASSQAQEEGDIDDNSADNKDDVAAGAALNLPTFLASKIRGAFQIQSDDNQDSNQSEATATERLSEPTVVAVQNEPEEVSLTTADDSDRVRESVSESPKQEVPEVGIAERIIGFLRPKRFGRDERLDAENAGATDVGSHYSDESQEERLHGIEEDSKDADTEQNDFLVNEEITETTVTVVESQYQEELPDESEYGTDETVDPTAKPSSNLAGRIREFLQPKRDQSSQEEAVSQATDDASSSQSQHKEPDQSLATSEIGQETESLSRTDNNDSSTSDSLDIGRKIRNFFQPGRTKKDLSVSLDQEIKTDARTANQPPERESGRIADDNMEPRENLHIFLAEKLVERLSEEELDSEENAEPQKQIVSEGQLEAKRVQSTLPEDSRDELVLMENRTEVNMDYTEDPNELRDASDSLDAFLQEDLNQHTSYEQGFTEEDGDDTKGEEIISETKVKAVESQTKDMQEILNEESPSDDQSEKSKSSRLPGILASAFKGFFQSKRDETPVDETGESALSTSVDMEEQVQIAHVSSVESGPPASSHDIVEDSSGREAIADKIEEKETAENLPLYLAARMKKLLEPSNKGKEEATVVSDEQESLQEDLEKEISLGDEPETSHRQLDSVNNTSENKSRNEAESVDEEKETAENLPIYLANRLKGFLRPTRPEQNMHDCPLCGQKVSEDAFKDIEMNSNDGKLWKVRGVNLKCNLVSEIRGGVYKTEIRIAADGTRSMAESYYKLV